MKTESKVTLETAAAHLRELQLNYGAEHLADYAMAAAKREDDYVGFLDSLAEAELADRLERRIVRRIREAKIPVTRSIASFDWTYPKVINRKQIEMLLRMDFLEEKSNVVFVGPCGVGKSFLASCLVENACRKGISALFMQAVDIANDLMAAKTANRLPQALRKYLSPSLLCIDELGYLPLGKDGCDLLFQVFSRRYEQKSTIVTTNKPFKEWGEIFNGDSTAAAAILDRIVHHCEVVKIEGRSYRMKDKLEK